MVECVRPAEVASMGEMEHRTQRESLRAVTTRPATTATATSEVLLQRYLSVALYAKEQEKRQGLVTSDR